MSKGAAAALAGLFVAAALAGGAEAQPASCMPAIASMSPCLGFIGANSSSSSPSASCCSQLAAVVQTQAQCLCAAIGPAAAQLIGIGMNQTRALSLPSACNVTAPPVSQCNAIAGAPTESPAGAPTTSAPAPSKKKPVVSAAPSASAPAVSAPKLPGASGPSSKTAPSAAPTAAANAAGAGVVAGAGAKALVSFVAAACLLALSDL